MGNEEQNTQSKLVWDLWPEEFLYEDKNCELSSACRDRRKKSSGGRKGSYETRFSSVGVGGVGRKLKRLLGYTNQILPKLVTSN
jgi:hypothetical protein